MLVVRLRTPTIRPGSVFRLITTPAAGERTCMRSNRSRAVRSCTVECLSRISVSAKRALACFTRASATAFCACDCSRRIGETSLFCTSSSSDLTVTCAPQLCFHFFDVEPGRLDLEPQFGRLLLCRFQRQLGVGGDE